MFSIDISVRWLRVAIGTVLLAVSACSSEPPPEPELIAPMVLDESELDVVDPNAVVPDQSIEAVVVDANQTTTVAGQDGLVPTPDKPVSEVVDFDDLSFVVGERVVVRTTHGSTRDGILKRYLNTSIKVLVNERGREIELDMPRSSILEVKVIWTKAHGAEAPSP